MKMKMKKDENLVQVQQQCSVQFRIRIIFESSFFWLNSLSMTNFDNFDNDQISCKIAQRQHFFLLFICMHSKILFFLGNQDDTRNSK